MESEVKCRNLKQGEVDIRQSIFQGEYFSPLVFVPRLNPLSFKSTLNPFGSKKGQCSL